METSSVFLSSIDYRHLLPAPQDEAEANAGKCASSTSTGVHVMKTLNAYQTPECVSITMHDARVKAWRALSAYELSTEDMQRATETLAKRLKMLLEQNGGRDLDSEFAATIARESLEWCGCWPVKRIIAKNTSTMPRTVERIRQRFESREPDAYSEFGK